MPDPVPFDFPLWVRITHAFNFLFMTLLWRSGVKIISAHPKFYWNDDYPPWKPWLRFTRKRMPRDRLWTSEDEIVPFPPWLAQPGDDHLGLGRHALLVVPADENEETTRYRH